MLQGLSHRPQAHWLASDEGVEGYGHHQGLLRRLFDQLLELLDNHVGKLPPRVIAVNVHTDVIELERIGNAQYIARPRAHPNRLIVTRPAKIVGIPRFLDQVAGHSRLDHAWTHPAGRPLAEVLCDCLRRLRDNPGFVVLPKSAKSFRVGPAVRAYVIAPALYPFDHFGSMVADQAVEQDRGRELQFIEHAEYAPDPDAEAVIAPGVVALGLRSAALRWISAAACQEGEPLHVQSDVKG